MRLIQECTRHYVKLLLGDKEWTWKPNATVRNRFCKCIAPFIEQALQWIDEDLVKRYKEYLYILLVEQKSKYVDDFIDLVIEITNQVAEEFEKHYNVEYPDLSQEFEDPMTISEFRDFHKLSVALKLVSFIIHSHHTQFVGVNTHYILNRLIKAFIKPESLRKVITFISSSINTSMYSRESMWNYLKDTLGITPEAHIQSVINYFFRAMMTYYDVSQQPNLMSYLAGFVNQSLYYLYTDSYERYIQYVNISKIRFSKEYNLIKQQVVFTLFDKIVQTIRQIFPNVHRKTNLDLFSKVYNVIPYDINQRGILESPVSKYFTYPLLSRIWNIPITYFNEYKYFRYIEIFMSLVTEYYLNLKVLAKLMRSVVIGRSKRRTKLNRIKIRQLEQLKFPESKYFKRKHFFLNVIQELKLYTYYDPITHDGYILHDDFLEEVCRFYRDLLEQPEVLREKLSPILTWFQQPELFDTPTVHAYKQRISETLTVTNNRN
jgi:hypothetical protein